MTEAELFEELREAVQKQVEPEVSLSEFDEALRAAMDAASSARGQAKEIVRANSLEDAAKRTLPAIKANEDAASRFKALKQVMLRAEQALDGNDDALRLALGRVLSDNGLVVEDDFHAASPIDGRWKLDVYNKQDVSWGYLKRVPDDDRLRADLQERRPEDAVGVFEDPAITGARLVQGEPGVKVSLKRKQRRAANE